MRIERLQVPPLTPVDKLFIATKKQINYFNIFGFGILLFICSYIFSRGGDKYFILFQSLQTIGLFLILIASITLIEWKIKNQYLMVLYSFFLIWHLILIFRDFNFQNYNYIKFFFFQLSFGGVIYLAPLLLLFPQNLRFYKKIFDLIILLSIFYIIYDVIFLNQLLNADRSSISSVGVVELSTDLSFPAGFILFTYAYHSKTKNWLAWGVILLTLVFVIIRARRGSILMTSSMIVSAYLLYLFSSKLKVLIFYLSILILLFVVMYTSALYRPEESIFGFLIERADEDTRSGVEEYFYADMKTKDWLFGRGLSGEYFCPDIEEDQITNYRSVIETGYLQMILKGGIISLGLLLLIAIPAIFKGLFYSNNILSKAAAIWILLALISMYPTIVHTFSLRYLLVWISIGICYSKTIRSIPDNKMKEYFLAPN